MSVSTICPNIDLNLQHKDIKLTSPASVTIRQWISTSYSNNQASFSMPPPSTSIFIDRCFLKATPVTINYTGNTVGPALLELGKDALRAYPIASITASDQLTLNNQQFVIQTSELVPYMARYWDQEHFSSFPSFLDTYQEYVDGFGANNNPLGSYADSINKHQLRGGYPMIIVNGALASSIQATIYEPIWVPVLHKEFDNGLGFTNIRTCDLVSNYNSNLARIVSHALSNATLTNVSVTMGQPIVYMKYNTPPVGFVPRTIQYGSEDINRFITQCPTAPLAPNVGVTFPSTNIQLNAIPKWMLVFCRESTGNLTYNSTDTALNISNISINFNNISGILSSASEVDLYKISAKNGLQDTWEQWHGVTSRLATQVGTTGSFLKLYFGKDVTLAPNSFPGEVGAFNLSMTVTVKNVNQSSPIIAPQLYIITSTHQKLVIHEGGQIETILGVSGEEGEYMPYDVAMEHYGGSFRDFLGKVGNFFTKVGKPVVDFLRNTKLISTVGKALSGVPIIGPAASTIGTVAERVGFGEDGGMEVGGMPVGGRVMSRAELLRRARKYK